MNILQSLFSHVDNDNLLEYKSLLYDKNTNLNSYTETELLLKIVTNKNKLFLREYIDFKGNEINYADFKKIFKIIISYLNTSCLNILFELKNINQYINFETIIDLSIEYEKYEVLNYILDNEIIDFKKNLYLLDLKKLIDVKDFNCINKILTKFDFNFNSNWISEYPIGIFLKCDIDIFRLLINFLISKSENYLDEVCLNIFNEYYDIDKFNFIYEKLNDLKEEFLEQCVYKSFYINNSKLLEYLIDNFNIDNMKILKILKKFELPKSSTRNLLTKIIKNDTKDTSYLLYEKFKEQLFTNTNNIIFTCIENNNWYILDNISIYNKQINIKKIEKYILDNYNNKYINEKIIDILLNKFKLYENKKFINNFIKLLINNNDKSLINYVFYYLIKFENTQYNQILKKIKSYVLNNIILNRLIEGDIFDWYFIEWLDLKFNKIEILKDSTDIIKINSKLYEPNIHFIYWYLKQKNKFLDKTDIDELLIRYHANMNHITDFLICNLDIDYILVDKIKSLLKNDGINRTKFIESLYSEKISLAKIKKLENFDEEMKDIFKNNIKGKLLLSPNILAKLSNLDNNDKLRYLINKTDGVKISSYKNIVNIIINNKNYDFLCKIDQSFINKDKFNFYSKLLGESIKNYDYIIFEWAFNNLEKNNYINDELDDYIKKILYNKLMFDSKNDYTIYNFMIKIYYKLSKNIKEVLNELILYYFNGNKIIISNFLENILNFQEYDNYYKFKFFQLFLYNVNRENIYILINKIDIKKEDYINFNNHLDDKEIMNNILKQQMTTIKYNLLYHHDLKFIIYLKDCGLNLKFDNSVLMDLFSCSYFNKRNNKLLNNKIILDIIIELASFDMFKINIETINIFLQHYSIIKCKITLENVKYLIETYKLEINFDTIYSSASSITKDIFDYLRSRSNLNLKENDEDLLLQVCLNNDVEFAKYLLIIEPTFNISKNNDNIFSQCCNEGSLDVIKWLYEIIPNMDEKTKYEYSICGACYYGHLDVAQWLVENIENIDLKIDNDYCMVNAVENECYEIVNWIMEIEPERYNVQYNEEMDEIISFTINKKLIIEENKKVEIITECPICFDKKSNIITCCNHQFCYDCFNEYYKKNTNICCPCCRKENIKLFNVN